MHISSKVFTELFKNFLFDLKIRKAAYCCWEFQVRRHFAFAIATLPLFQHPENVKISIFPIIQCPSRNAVSSKVFNEFSKIFFWLKDEEGGYSGWKFQEHRCFGFPLATLPLFLHPENVKISIIPVYTIPGEMLYLQKYLTNFQKLSFGWKTRKLAIVDENFKCADVLVLQ